MRENPLKARLKAGETVVGSFHPIPAPGIVELYGLVGFDFVIVDAEHGPSSVETQEAIDNLDEIVKVEGVDVVFIGPNDLATSLGYPGESANPKVLEVIEGLVKRIHAAGLPSGITAYDSAGIARARGWGIQFI